MPSADEVLRRAGITPTYRGGKRASGLPVFDPAKTAGAGAASSPFDKEPEELSLNPFDDKGWSLNPFRLARQGAAVAFSIPQGLWEMGAQGWQQLSQSYRDEPLWKRLITPPDAEDRARFREAGGGGLGTLLTAGGAFGTERQAEAQRVLPLGYEMGTSMQRTAGRIANPSRFLDAANRDALIPTLVEDVGNVAMVGATGVSALGLAPRLSSSAAAARVGAVADAARPWTHAPLRTMAERGFPAAARRVTPLIERSALGADAVQAGRTVLQNRRARRAVRADIEQPSLESIRVSRQLKKLADRADKVLGRDADLRYATVLLDAGVGDLLRPLADALRTGRLTYDSPEVTKLLDDLFGPEQKPGLGGEPGRPSQRSIEVVDDYLSGRLDPEVKARMDEARSLNDRARQIQERIKLDADEYRLNPEQLGDEAMPSKVDEVLRPLRREVDRLRTLIYGRNGRGGLNARAARARARVPREDATTLRPERTARAGVRLGETLGVMNLTAEQSNRLASMLKDSGEMAAAAGIEGLASLRARLNKLKKQYRQGTAGQGPATEAQLAQILELEKQIEALQQSVDAYLASRPDLSDKLAGYDAQVRAEQAAARRAAEAEAAADEARARIFREGAEDYDLMRLFGDDGNPPPPGPDGPPAPRRPTPPPPPPTAPAGPSVITRERPTRVAEQAPDDLTRILTPEETPNLPEPVGAAGQARRTAPDEAVLADGTVIRPGATIDYGGAPWTVESLAPGAGDTTFATLRNAAGDKRIDTLVQLAARADPKFAVLDAILQRGLAIRAGKGLDAAAELAALAAEIPDVDEREARRLILGARSTRSRGGEKKQDAWSAFMVVLGSHMDDERDRIAEELGEPDPPRTTLRADEAPERAEDYNRGAKTGGGGDTRSAGEQSPAAPGAGAVGVRADSPARHPTAEAHRASDRAVRDLEMRLVERIPEELGEKPMRPGGFVRDYIEKTFYQWSGGKRTPRKKWAGNAAALAMIREYEAARDAEFEALGQKINANTEYERQWGVPEFATGVLGALQWREANGFETPIGRKAKPNYGKTGGAFFGFAVLPDQAKALRDAGLITTAGGVARLTDKGREFIEGSPYSNADLTEPPRFTAEAEAAARAKGDDAPDEDELPDDDVEVDEDGEPLESTQAEPYVPRWDADVVVRRSKERATPVEDVIPGLVGIAVTKAMGAMIARLRRGPREEFRIAPFGPAPAGPFMGSPKVVVPVEDAAAVADSYEQLLEQYGDEMQPAVKRGFEKAVETLRAVPPPPAKAKPTGPAERTVPDPRTREAILAAAGDNPLVVLSCAAKKATRRAPAAELYDSGYFRLNLAAARAMVPEDRIRILSAKHGLVRLDTELDPYDTTIADLTDEEQQALAAKVRTELAAVGGTGAVVLGGDRYSETVAEAGVMPVVQPYANLNIGQQQSLAKKIAGDAAEPTVVPRTDEDVTEVLERRTEVLGLIDQALTRLAGDVDQWQVTPPYVILTSYPVSAAVYERWSGIRAEAFTGTRQKPRRYLDTSVAARIVRENLPDRLRDAYLAHMKPKEEADSRLKSLLAMKAGPEKERVWEERFGAELLLDEMRENGHRNRQFETPLDAVTAWATTWAAIDALERAKGGDPQRGDAQVIADELNLDATEVAALFPVGKGLHLLKPEQMARRVASDWRAWRAEADADMAERRAAEAEADAATELPKGRPFPEGLDDEYLPAWKLPYDQWLATLEWIDGELEPLIDPDYGTLLPEYASLAEYVTLLEGYLAHLDPARTADQAGYDTMLAVYAGEAGRERALPESLVEQPADAPTPALDPEQPATIDVPAARLPAVLEVFAAADEQAHNAVRRAFDLARERNRPAYVVDARDLDANPVTVNREVREVRPATGDFLEVNPDGSLLVYRAPVDDGWFVAGPPEQPPGGGGGGKPPAPPAPDDPPPPPEDEGPMFGPGPREAAGARRVGEAEERAAAAWVEDEVTRQRARTLGNRPRADELRYSKLGPDERRIYRALQGAARATSSEQVRRMIATDRLAEVLRRGQKQGYRAGERAGKVAGRTAEQRRMLGQVNRRNRRERARFQRRVDELHKAVDADARRAESVFTRKGTRAEQARVTQQELGEALDRLTEAERTLAQAEAMARAGSIRFPDVVPGSWKSLLYIARRHNAWVVANREYLERMGVDGSTLDGWLMPETIKGWKDRGITEPPRYVPGAHDNPVGGGLAGGGRAMLPRRGRHRGARMKQSGEIPTDPRTMYRAWMDDVSQIAKTKAARVIAGRYGRTAGELIDMAINALDEGDPFRQELLDRKAQGGHDLAAWLRDRGWLPWDEMGQRSVMSGDRVQASTRTVGPDTETRGRAIEVNEDGSVVVDSSTVMLPSAVMREYQRWYKPSESHWIVRGYDYLTRGWKHAVLALNPYWQVGNVVGNTLLATIGGAATPWDLYRHGRTAYRLLREEQRTGQSHFPGRLYGAGATSDVLRFLEDKADPRTPIGRLIRSSYALNEFVDDLGRSTMYLLYAEKGMPEHLAVAEALKIMGDFQRMTPFEQNVVRRIFPFYAWTRHVTTLAFHLTVDHPLRTAWTMHLATWTMEPEEMMQQMNLPPFIRGAIPIGDGGWYFPAANLVPYTQIAANPLLSPREGIRGLNPVIQLGLNALFGVNPRQARLNTMPAGYEPVDWYGRRVFGGNSPEGVAYFLSQQTPASRLIFSALADNVVRYDTGQPIKRGGRTIEPEGGRIFSVASNLGIPLPQPVDEQGIAQRRDQRALERERARRRYER